MMTFPDFLESDSNALSQILRSVAPPGAAGAGAPPLVRVVRGAGAEGRWTEVHAYTHTHIIHKAFVCFPFCPLDFFVCASSFLRALYAPLRAPVSSVGLLAATPPPLPSRPSR